MIVFFSSAEEEERDKTKVRFLFDAHARYALFLYLPSPRSRCVSCESERLRGLMRDHHHAGKRVSPCE